MDVKKTLILILAAIPTGIAVGAVDAVFGRVLRFEDAPRIMLITGMSAGFAGLFRTPFAATAFAMEVLTAGRLEHRALLPAATAALCASATSGLLGLEIFTFAVTELPDWNAELLIKLAVLGLAFGLAGAAFTYLLKKCKKEAQTRLKNPILRTFVMGLALSAVLLILWRGRYSGLGTNLINASLAGGTVYAWDWAAKLVLTALTLSAGYQGGEVTLLFSIGASLGAAASGLIGLPAALCAAMGYAAVFGSATNTLIAPALIGAEVFGWAAAPYMLVTCALAYAVTGTAPFTRARGKGKTAIFAALHRKYRRKQPEFVLQRVRRA